MEPKLPWYYRNVAVALGLVVCPPIGLVLVWVGSRWSRSTKVIASVLSVCVFGWFLARDSSRSQVPARQAARQENRKQTGEQERAQVSTTAEAIAFETEPRLLVPSELSGATSKSARRLPGKVGVRAVYDLSEKRVVILVAEKSSAELPTPTTGEKLVEVNGHPGLQTEEPDQNVAILWRSGDWGFALMTQFPKKFSRASTIKIAQSLASESATWADRQLDPAETFDPQSSRDHIRLLEAAESAALQAEVSAEAERRRPDLVIEQKSATDSAAGTINFELSVFNVGSSGASMSDRCEITLTDGRTCIKKTSANFILRAFTRSPAKTGKKEFIAPPELYDRLRNERTLPSGGEATLWAKFPFHEVQNCDMSKVTAQLNCNAAYAPIDAWPEAVDFLAARKNP